MEMPRPRVAEIRARSRGLLRDASLLVFVFVLVGGEARGYGAT